MGRGAVDLDLPDIAKAYTGRAVLITGAGGSFCSTTPHPKILRAQEAFPSQTEMAALLRELMQAVDQQMPEKVRQVIIR